VKLINDVLETTANANASSAVSIYPETWHADGPDSGNKHFVISGNLLNTGGSYTMYLGYTPSAGESPNRDITVTDNVFGTKYSPNGGEYGPVASYSGSYPGEGVPNEYSNVWAHNVWSGGPHDGQLVTP